MGITVNVESEEIGAYCTLIDLTNPNDTLHFQFGDDVTGNVHILRFDERGGAGISSFAASSVFFIHTAAEVTELPRADHYDLLFETSDDAGLRYEYAVLAEVPLGREEAGYVTFGEGVPDTYSTVDNLNDDPVITSNIAWSSVARYSYSPAIRERIVHTGLAAPSSTPMRRRTGLRSTLPLGG
jgi:hypothetical protein